MLAGGELARRMVDRLYAATTSKEAHLCKVALRSLVEADIECRHCDAVHLGDAVGGQ